MLPAFLIAGLGMTLAGVVLDSVQKWTFFVEVPEMFILIPPLLGLKGNVEMTLASRLSTQVPSASLMSLEMKWKEHFSQTKLLGFIK